MSNLLILGAGQHGVTLSENIVKGFGHGDNCAYTGKFYSEAGIGIICRLFVPAFAFMWENTIGVFRKVYMDFEHIDGYMLV